MDATIFLKFGSKKSVLIFKKLSQYLGMHLESWFGPEQTEQNSYLENYVQAIGIHGV